MKRTLRIAFALGVFTLGALVSTATAQAPGGRGGAAGGGGGGRGGRTPITPRIVTFEAEPASIQPGESFDLSWATEAGTGTIDNGVGAVPISGTLSLTPDATTTYTLSLAGGDVTRSVTVTVAGTTPVAPAVADGATTPTGRRRIDGRPDFSGVYGFGGGGRGRGRGGDVAEPASPFADLPGQPTLRPGVDNQAEANPSGGTSDCLPLPADSAFGVPYPFQIIQNENYVLFIHEYPGTFRIIPLDQPHGPNAADDPTWMGDSVGSWEGDTLVIDTIGYNGRHSIGGIQQPSEQFHTIERLTPTGPSSFFYEIIYEDPERATGQWRSTRSFSADTRPGVVKVMEFICENNRDYTPLFGPEGPPAGRGGRGGRGGQ